MSLVAGVDCSTQATKVVIVDADSGEVVATGRADHEVHTGDGASESHPDTWWEALGSALAQTGRAGDVAAISVGGQQHGLVLRDDHDRPVRPAPLWNDTRSADDATMLTDAFGAQWWAETVGTVPVASVTVTSWAWLRRVAPDDIDRTRAVCLPHDQVTFGLTGEHVTDRGDASGTGWWSPREGRYVEDVLSHDVVDLSPDLLPRVLDPDEAAGQVTDDAAEALGLRAGIPVGPGTGDNMAAALGLGVDAGMPVVSLGTSGTAYMVSTTPTGDPTGTLAGFASADGRFLPLAATLNCTLATDRVARWLGLDRADVADRDRDPDASGDGDGSNGPLFLPWFDGERTPNIPEASGALIGLRHDTTPQQILGAAYIGAAASLLDAVDRLADASSGVADDAPLTITGGGAKGAAWISTFQRLSPRPLRVIADVEAVALGAAAQAAAVLAGTNVATVRDGWRSVIDAEHDGRGDGAHDLERVRALSDHLTPWWQRHPTV